MCEDITFERIVEGWTTAGVLKKATYELLTFDEEFEFTAQCLRYFVECEPSFRVLPYPIIASNKTNLRYLRYILASASRILVPQKGPRV